jgi:predicted outer membrane lipoprotein
MQSHRQVLLFGHEQPAYHSQQALLRGCAGGLTERDVKVIDARHQSMQYKVDASRFAIILVGKDGGEKFRSYKPVACDSIFAIIDAMPMRQAEMRNRKQ